MTFLKGDHLRVVSPQTIDGTTLKYGDDGKVMYKETFLPITAKKSLVLQNTRLPAHLKKIIELVSANGPITVAPAEDKKARTTVKARTPAKTSLV